MDYILLDGDQVLFQPMFGSATVVPQPGNIKGSGGASLSGTKVCIEGDEGSVQVAGVMYSTPVYSIPGTGTLLIDQLAANQIADHTHSNNKKVLLKGSQFTAKFQVQSPAQQPSPSGPVPDGTPLYSNGKGSFVSANTKFRGK